MFGSPKPSFAPKHTVGETRGPPDRFKCRRSSSVANSSADAPCTPAGRGRKRGGEEPARKRKHKVQRKPAAAPTTAAELDALAKAAVENDEQEARCREGIMGLEEADETDDACSQDAFLCFRRFLKDNGSSAFYDSGEIDGMAKFRAVQVRSSAREPSCPR